LEKCVEHENYLIGWTIASQVLSVNEHTIEEVVTLCSKSFFKYARGDRLEANKWFDRVEWVVERHCKLLGKYPAGLAMHVAAHRGDFDLCWKWFNLKREEKSFRFTAHHTSAIFKAATYARDPAAYMEFVIQAYRMTPTREKSPFVFEPLYHLWMNAETTRIENSTFWDTVNKDLKEFLDSNPRSSDERKIRKLSTWLREMDGTSNNNNNGRKQSQHRLTRRTMSSSSVDFVKPTLWKSSSVSNTSSTTASTLVTQKKSAKGKHIKNYLSEIPATTRVEDEKEMSPPTVVRPRSLDTMSDLNHESAVFVPRQNSALANSTVSASSATSHKSLFSLGTDHNIWSASPKSNSNDEWSNRFNSFLER